MFRARLLSAIDNREYQLSLCGCSVRDMLVSRILRKRKQPKPKRIRSREYVNTLMAEYFAGISTYRCPLSLTPVGSSTPPSSKLMKHCELGGIIASLPAEQRAALVNRWELWTRYQEAKKYNLECKVDLYKKYRTISKRTAYRDAMQRVAEVATARGV